MTPEQLTDFFLSQETAINDILAYVTTAEEQVKAHYEEQMEALGDIRTTLTDLSNALTQKVFAMQAQAERAELAVAA